jgi:hypothetical protein
MRTTEKQVHIVYRPNTAFVGFGAGKTDVPRGEGRHRRLADEKAKRFIEEYDLFKIKPDFRVFVWGDDKDQGVNVSIPDDMELPPEYKKRVCPAGLYASYIGKPGNFDLGKWVEDSGKYEWFDNNGERMIGLEYFNPYNVLGLADYDYDSDWNCSYPIELFPVMEIKNFTEAEKEQINFKLRELEQNGKRMITTVLITPDNPVEIIEQTTYKSQQEFTFPVKLTMRVKTTQGSISAECAGMNFCYMERTGKNGVLGVNEPKHDSWMSYKWKGTAPVNEFVEIEMFFGINETATKLNGDLRFYGTEQIYISQYKNDPDFNMIGTIKVGTGFHSVLTVESLVVTEM